jgi:hypothetical protein
MSWRYQSFEEARELVRGLGIQSVAGWVAYNRSGNKPPDIPADPQRVFRDQGWKGYGDWLGTGTVALFLREYRRFEAARTQVHLLQLTSRAGWVAYCKSGKKPDDIPAAPWQVYKDDGWKGMRDWLGTAD